MCTALIRFGLSPLELVKTQLQLNPKHYGGEEATPAGGSSAEPAWKRIGSDIMSSPGGGKRRFGISPGVQLLFRGADASAVVGFLLGGISFAQVLPGALDSRFAQLWSSTAHRSPGPALPVRWNSFGAT